MTLTKLVTEIKQYLKLISLINWMKLIINYKNTQVMIGRPI